MVDIRRWQYSPWQSSSYYDKMPFNILCMKTHTLPLAACAALITALSGCTNAEGRFRPIDPLGRAIFDALDPGPRRPNNQYNSQYNNPPNSRYNDQQYVDSQDYGPDLTDYNQRPGRDYIWVGGRYEQDYNGRRVWVPAHWTRVMVQ